MYKYNKKPTEKGQGISKEPEKKKKNCGCGGKKYKANHNYKKPQ